MTQTEWLKQNISEVEKLLSRDEERLLSNPDSFAAQIQVRNMSERLSDLTQELRDEMGKEGE